MSVSLKKGDKISLTKDFVVNNISIRLGWDVSKYEDGDFDLDASCFVIQKNGKTRCDEDFIFYNNLQHPSGAIVHSGDDLVGGGNKDNEIIRITLSKLPRYAERVVFVITINEAERRMQNFGMVNNSFLRIVDERTNSEIVRYDLKEKFGNSTAIEVGEIYKDGVDWKFHAIGNGFVGGLATLCDKYGIDIG